MKDDENEIEAEEQLFKSEQLNICSYTIEDKKEKITLV